jgi:hypothetical protein
MGCRTNLDLDSTDHHLTFKSTSKGGKTQMAPLKSGVLYPYKSFCENRSEKMA